MTRLESALAVGLMALTVGLARGEELLLRESDCSDVARRARSARTRAERALSRTSIAAVRVHAEMGAAKAGGTQTTAIEIPLPPRKPTPTTNSPDREVLAAVYERVNAIAPSVLRFSALAVNGVDPRVKAAPAGEMKPPMDAEAIRNSSCAEILARVEENVFRLDQAMQAAEVAADQAIALAMKRNSQE